MKLVLAVVKCLHNVIYLFIYLFYDGAAILHLGMGVG